MGYNDTIEKPLSELPEHVDFSLSNWTPNWSYGKWGNADYAISRVLGDGTEHRYKIPRAIGLIIEREYQKGKEDAQKEIQTALGL
jgi:hypothetical protein